MGACGRAGAVVRRSSLALRWCLRALTRLACSDESFSPTRLAKLGNGFLKSLWTKTKTAAARDACKTRADIMYAAVRVAGGSVHMDYQRVRGERAMRYAHALSIARGLRTGPRTHRPLSRERVPHLPQLALMCLRSMQDQCRCQKKASSTLETVRNLLRFFF
jgi:hypothetical protein